MIATTSDEAAYWAEIISRYRQISCGNKDGLIRIGQGIHAYHKEHDVPHVRHVDAHGHDATGWGRNFYLFARRLFR